MSENHPHENHHALSDAEYALSSQRVKFLSVAIGLNLSIVISQTIFGFVSNSLGLLADAGHNFVDVGGLVLALYAVILIRRPAKPHNTYGNHRIGILAAQANAVLIILATIYITYEAVLRLANPEPVDGLSVLIVASIAAVANIVSALFIHKSETNADGRSRDLNIRAATIHLIGDGAASIAVAISGLIIFLTDSFYWIDPLVSLGIGGLIAIQAIKLLQSSNSVLMESVPKDIDTEKLNDSILSISQVCEIHDLHIWSLSSDMRALSMHVVVNKDCTLTEAQEVITEIKNELQNSYSISHATIEVETEQ